MKNVFLIISLILYIISGYSQTSETFTNIPTASSSSYLNRSWTGDNGGTWTATNARTDQTLNGKAICLKNLAGSSVLSNSVAGGCGVLTFSHQQAFSGSGGNLSVKVNGSVVASGLAVSTSVTTENITVNIAGTVQVEIISDGNVRVIIDDVSWTAYSGVTGTSTISSGAAAEPASISSLINTSGAAVANFDFSYLDDGATPSTDALPTQITKIVFNQGIGNDGVLGDWTQAIAGATLSDGTSTITGTVNATNITFSSITSASPGDFGYIADNASKTYTLKIWLLSSLGGSLPTTIDGKDFVFEISSSSITLNPSGSGIASGQTVSSGDGNNTVDVVATELAFVQQPSNTEQNATMTPYPSVSANDANGNRDLDYSGSISITSSGTLTSSPQTSTAASGIASFSSIVHSATGTGLTLTASATGLTNAVSNTFDITPPVTLVITEVNSKGHNGNFNDEYIEISNTGSSTINLTGWTLEYYNNTGLEQSVSLSGTLAANSAYVIAARSTHTTNISPDIIGYFSMNSSCHVILKQGGVIKDQAGSSGDQFTSDINYEFTNCPNDNLPTANWNNLGTGNGTPGVINGACAMVPEINVQVSGTDYLTGSTYDFGALAVGNSSSITFTIQNTGFADLTITTPLTTSGSAYSVTSQPSSPVSASSSTTFTVTFSPTTAGTLTGSVTIINNDNDEGSYTINFTGVGLAGSNTSDIIADPSFVYPTNILAINYTNTNVSTSDPEVFKFIIRDGGATSDGDALTTTLTSISFNISNWNLLKTIALYDGITKIQEVASASTITFSGITASAADNGSKTLSLRVTFNTNVTDNQQFSFTVSAASADVNGSVFGSANAGGAVSSTAGDDNRIEVQATTIKWGSQPSDQITNTPLDPFSIYAVDANGNTDLDENSCSVALTTSGTGMTSSSPYTFSSGAITISDVSFSSINSNISITASAQSCLSNASITSNSFNITSFTYLSGDWRTTQDYAGLAFNGYGWESFDGTSWTPETTAPQNIGYAPSRIIIRHLGIDAGDNSGASSRTYPYNDIIILSGGELIMNDKDKPPVAREFIAPGKKLEVYSGGILRVNGDFDMPSSLSTPNFILRDGATMYISRVSAETSGSGADQGINNQHPMWDGYEDFQDNSTIIIEDWDYSAPVSDRSILDPSMSGYQININSSGNGYRFGNIIYDYTPQVNDQTILPALSSPLKFCNNLTINNKSTTKTVSITANQLQSPKATIQGNVIIKQGTCNIGINYTDNAYQGISILGNLELQNTNPSNPTVLYLHNFGAGASVLGRLRINLYGDLIIGAGTTIATGKSSDISSREKTMLFFTGTNSQVVSGSGTTDLTNVTIDKSINHVTLNRDLQVNDSLVFSSGNFILGNNNLINGTSTNMGTQVGGSSGSYAVTDGLGTYTRMQLITSTDLLFPIGPSISSYNPATLNYTGTIDDFSARVEIGLNPTTGNDPAFVNRTWHISEATSGGTNAIIKFQWEAAHENPSFSRPLSNVYHYQSGWGEETFDSRGGSNPYWAAANNITSFSPFAVGKTAVLPIELLNFTAHYNNEKKRVELNWTTISELNNDYFTVLK
ncbi:MAG: choice-of-anchor D domain-containing protein, partial [Bacteroidetes bacterium]